MIGCVAALRDTCGAWYEALGMRRGRVLVLVAAAATAASCTGGQQRSAATHPGRSASHVTAVAGCPVTHPLPHALPPALPPLPVSYIHGWYGNDALWIGVPAGGLLPAGRPYGTPWPNEWGTKFPWWRIVPGQLTIKARRLDGPSAGFHAEIPSGYGMTGFNPSGLIWPSPGCWQVTGTVAGKSLTFVARVVITDS
jgi:hypothetical protein